MENVTDFIPESYEVVNNSPLIKVGSVCSSLDLSPLDKVATLNKDQRQSALKRRHVKSQHLLRGS